MLDKPISPLRQRMIDDMTARRFKEKVQKDYVRHVRNIAAFLRRSPDTATSEDVRSFQLHLAKQQIGAPTINSAIAALRFFFNVTLERPDLVRGPGTVRAGDDRQGLAWVETPSTSRRSRRFADPFDAHPRFPGARLPGRARLDAQVVDAEAAAQRPSPVSHADPSPCALRLPPPADATETAAFSEPLSLISAGCPDDLNLLC